MAHQNTSVTIKATDTGNLDDILSEAIGEELIETYVRIYKVSRCKRALIRPTVYIPNLVRQMVSRKIEELGGLWDPDREMWEVPLARR